MKQTAAAFEIRELLSGEIRELYVRRLARDFPPDELKPLSAIERALSQGKYVCYGAVDEGAILAYAYFVKMGKWALADYYAVEETHRNAGIGSRFLQALVAGPLRDMECVLLEVEDPEQAKDAAEREIRERRRKFYLRNGLRDTGVAAEVWHVPYRILELPLGAPLGAEQVRQIYAALYREIMPRKTYDAMVRL